MTYDPAKRYCPEKLSTTRQKIICAMKWGKVYWHGEIAEKIDEASKSVLEQMKKLEEMGLLKVEGCKDGIRFYAFKEREGAA